MSGPKTNEREGTRAVLRYYHMSASKARIVLDLIRGEDVNTAREILAGTTREAADVIGKLLASAVANAQNNEGQSPDELYVAAAFADEGPTMKRFTPRARGRAGRIKKRSTHITVIVARMDEDRIQIVRAARSAQAAASRTRRVASSRRRADQQASLNKRESAAEAEALEAANRAAEEEANEALETDAVVDTDEATDEDADVEATTESAEAGEHQPEATPTASEDATEETDK
jgi:large subunit ribosomal protein L22